MLTVECEETEINARTMSSREALASYLKTPQLSEDERVGKAMLGTKVVFEIFCQFFQVYASAQP